MLFVWRGYFFDTWTSVLLIVQKSGDHQLRLVGSLSNYPIMYKVLSNLWWCRISSINSTSESFNLQPKQVVCSQP